MSMSPTMRSFPMDAIARRRYRAGRAAGGELIAAHRPHIVVIACNTASTLVMPHLRAAYGVPFVGTVPAIKPACASSKTKRVSVLGTKATVKREYTQALIRDYGQGCEVTLVGSAELASLAEAALKGNDVSDGDIAAELAPCFVGRGADDPARTDTVVLACTHYPLLLDRLTKLAPWPVDWMIPPPPLPAASPTCSARSTARPIRPAPK